MTYAYQEIYLSNAQSMPGDAFDYGINACHSPGSSFVKLFVASTISKRLENGKCRMLRPRSTLAVPGNTGLIGQLPTINGFPAEATATSSRWLPLKNYRECTIPFMKRIRTAYGCTQAELAKRSGVSLRSIQMYEQRNKDINKASAETLLRLSKVLGCTMEDLMEK